MKKKKRLFAILLAFCVTFTMMPLAGSGGGGACCGRNRRERCCNQNDHA